MEKEAQELLVRLQGQNQQLQTILLQKQSLQIQANEIDNALEELEKAKDDVFHLVGPVLIKSEKEKLKKELKDSKEDVDLKIKTLERQEKKIRERMREDQERFQKFLPKPDVQAG